MNYICTTCKETKDEQDMEYTSKRGTGRCRLCNCTRNRQAAIFKRAMKCPSNFKACCECDEIFSRFGSGRKIKKERTEKTKCPYCSSNNIEDFI